MANRGPGSSTDATPSLTEAPEWTGPSSDPNDRQFGDVVDPATLDEAGRFDVVLVGEPYDGAVIGRRGAAHGPAAIRESFAAVKTHHVDVGPVGHAGTGGHDESDPGDDEGGRDDDDSRDDGGFVGDLGDIAVDPDASTAVDPDASVATVQQQVRSITRRIHEAGAVPVFLGGDNSLTFPNAAPLLDHGSVGALSFDAHLDCREVRPDVGPTSGTPYRQLLEAGLDALSVVGARHFETSTAYHEYASERGVHVATPEDVAGRPLDALEDAVAALGDVDAVHVSVDVDVLDAAAAPGVSAPTPGGLTTRELYRTLDHLARQAPVAGFEVVECAPPLDRDDRTVDAAARAVAHFLAGLRPATDRPARVEGRDG